MPKIKPHRKAVLDMTPVVDLAFLLVTFFMLTTQFRPDEPVIVDMPKSEAERILPDKDIITITISDSGKVYFNVDNKKTRSTLIKSMNERYDLKLEQAEMNTFAILSTFGVPIGAMKQFLSFDSEQRKEYKQPGIPVDSLNNELTTWLLYTRASNQKARIAIKGDGEAAYPIIKKVMNTLKDQNITNFNLITNLEDGGSTNQTVN